MSEPYDWSLEDAARDGGTARLVELVKESVTDLLVAYEQQTQMAVDALDRAYNKIEALREEIERIRSENLTWKDARSVGGSE